MYLSTREGGRRIRMDPYNPTQLAQPLKQAKRKNTTRSILKNMEHTQLTPIHEEPKMGKRQAPDPALLQAETQTTQAILQRNEALEALDSALTSASAKQKLQERAIEEHIIQQTRLKQRVQELEASNKLLEERCVKLSAWADQHRSATSKLQAQLQISQNNEALSALANLDAKHTALNTAHAALAVAHTALQKTHTSLETEHATLKSKYDIACQKINQNNNHSTDLELSKTFALLKSAEERADKAERSLQSLLCCKKLTASAPMAQELLDKAALVLGSSTDVLRHVHCKSEASPQLRSGLNQVCDALADLEVDLRGHSANVGAWLARRAAVG
jgi:hypothetical protein